MKENYSNSDQELLASLALAMVEKPRANLQELAKMVGVSKATLYRFCRTRAELVERLVTHCSSVITTAVEQSVAIEAPAFEALQLFANRLLAHRELTAFLIHYCQSDSPEMDALEQRWANALDSFFLKNQQLGHFRIDLGTAALSELWMSIIIGFIDAERRGRVARANLSTLIVNAFLNGASSMIK